MKYRRFSADEKVAIEREAQRMRESGMTYEAIGEALGVTRQRVHQILKGYRSPRMKTLGFRKLGDSEMDAVDGVVYPVIREWMLANRFGFSRLAALSGISKCGCRYVLLGKGEPRKETRVKIARAIGKPEREAFRGIERVMFGEAEDDAI